MIITPELRQYAIDNKIPFTDDDYKLTPRPHAFYKKRRTKRYMRKYGFSNLCAHSLNPELLILAAYIANKNNQTELEKTFIDLVVNQSARDNLHYVSPELNQEYQDLQPKDYPFSDDDSHNFEDIIAYFNRPKTDEEHKAIKRRHELSELNRQNELKTQTDALIQLTQLPYDKTKPIFELVDVMLTMYRNHTYIHLTLNRATIIDLNGVEVSKPYGYWVDYLIETSKQLQKQKLPKQRLAAYINHVSQFFYHTST